jgi:hypothetical protein
MFGAFSVLIVLPVLIIAASLVLYWVSGKGRKQNRE